MRLRIGFCLVLVALSTFAASAEPVLERVVMLSRHGVRSPLRKIEALEGMTKSTWPKWPVPPGEMTEHGARNLTLMADFLRQTYQRKGLLPNKGCPAEGAIDIWSDAADNRTRQSGDIFASRLAPDCGVRARYEAGGVPDALFDATSVNACVVGTMKRVQAAASLWRQGSGLSPDETHALKSLQDVVAPDACNVGGAGACLMPEPAAGETRLNEALGKAAAIAEALYLEYAQGFPAAGVGWGRPVDDVTIAAIMPVYERGINFVRRNPVVAARRGVLLARTIVALLDGKKPPADAPSFSSSAKLAMIAGHDSNLLQMAVLMGLDWHFAKQPIFTPPDATLAFEVWRDPASDRRTVRLVIYAQTLAQLREGTTLDARNPPEVVAVVPQACEEPKDAGCALSDFTADVERRLASLCDS